MKISLIVPCYNEQEGIPQLAQALADVRRALEPVYRLELVFVDDGSTDGTRAVLDRHFGADPSARIVSHPVNRGLGAALRTGFAHATGELVATTDSDCTYDPRQLPDMVRLTEAGADVVVASPYHPEGAVRNVPRYRLFLSHTLSRLYDLVVGAHVYTYTSLFRIYRAETLRDLRVESDGFVSMAELLVGALLRGAKVAEYPTQLSIRNYGESKAAIARVIRQHLRFLARVLWWRLSGRLRVAPGRAPGTAGEHRARATAAPAPFRPPPPAAELASWNRALNRSHGMAVLAEHPNALVRWHERDRKRRILRMVRPGTTDLVIEVGCERGDLSARIASTCRYLVCVDIDADVLADARGRLAGRRAGFVVADAQALPIRTGCTDIGVSTHTLEHLPDPVAGLRELARTIRPTGRVAINVPNDRWVLFLKRIVFRILRVSRAFDGISPTLAPGHLWVFHPGLLRETCAGALALGALSFNAPFFTNIFVTGRPVAHAGRTDIRARTDA